MEQEAGKRGAGKGESARKAKRASGGRPPALRCAPPPFIASSRMAGVFSRNSFAALVRLLCAAPALRPRALRGDAVASGRAGAAAPCSSLARPESDASACAAARVANPRAPRSAVQPG